MADVRQALRRDREQVVDILVEGFLADEFFQWVLGHDAGAYTTYLRQWMELAYECAIRRGGAYVRTDGTGAALWAPPDTHFFDRADGERIGEIVATANGDRFDLVLGGLMEIDSFHTDDLDASYLHAIAVVPAAQGRGVGGTLLDHVLRRCDEDDVPAYLEASSARSAALYERHGYSTLADVHLPESGPIVRPMLRPAEST